LNIRQEEIQLFLWTAVLLFLIRSSGLFFNNFAETAFLKRFGVEYLPIVTAVNSVTTFVLMGLLTGVMARMPGSLLLSYTLLVCGGSVGLLRFVIPLDLGFLYPVLYVLKTQYEVLLGFLFWNLANDLFDTRQSKRIFPLITAGGIVGAVLGSFGTPILAKTISVNNLMFAYLVTTWLGAATVHRMGKIFPATLVVSGKPKKKGSSRFAIASEIKKAVPLIRESDLAKALVLLTLLPNVVIPIINYQFSYVVDQTYATEGGMVGFYGYFRGVQNVIALVISLFVGRIYGRFGIPVALMFHPFNYVIAFAGYLLRFDIFSAIYATLSTGVLRNTVNAPARAVLYGLFPPEQNAIIRPFLRGTVVRIGVLIGSGIVLVSQDFVSPRYLSFVALFFVFAWIGSTFFLKKRYRDILLNLIQRGTVDIRSLEQTEAEEIFRDETVWAPLVEKFEAARGPTCVWYARLLRSLDVPELDTRILTKIREVDDGTRMKLLPILSARVGEEAAQTFLDLADPERPELMVAFARTARRVYADAPPEFEERVYQMATIPEVKAMAMTGLYRRDPVTYGPVVDDWLASENLAERRAGVIAVMESGERVYLEKLREMVATQPDETLLPLLLQGLRRLGEPDVNEVALMHLADASERVRRTALGCLELEDEKIVRAVVRRMGDPSDAVRDAAIEKLENASIPVGPILVEFLTAPNRRIREGIFHLSETLKTTDVAVFGFCRAQLEKAYEHVAELQALEQMPGSSARDLLAEHLDQQRLSRVENVVRVLVARDASGEMRAIWRGISSSKPRRRANSLEALETKLDRALTGLLLPMLESIPLDERLKVGQKQLGVSPLPADGEDLATRLLTGDDPVTVLLTLQLALSEGLVSWNAALVARHAASDDEAICRLAQQVLERATGAEAGEEGPVETKLSVAEKIVALRGVEIFAGLSVAELTAVASVTEEASLSEGTVLTEEDEFEDALHVIVSGEVIVESAAINTTRTKPELTRFGPGDALGLPALFGEAPPAVTVRTASRTEFLRLSRDEFEAIAKEYPEVTLHICRVLSKRLHWLVSTITEGQSVTKA
jgi:ATP/ADP translocase